MRWLPHILVGGALLFAWPLLPALVLAAWTAAIARPIRVRLEALLRGRTRAAATATLLLFAVFALPLFLLGVGLLSGVNSLTQTLAGAPSATAALQALASHSDTWVAPDSLEEVASLLGRYGAQALQLGSRIASALFKGVILLFVYFAGVYSSLLWGDASWAWIEAHAPIPVSALNRFRAAFHETGRGLLFGVGLTASTQALIATLVYVGLDVPRGWVLGPLTGIAAIVPVVGTSLVWAPVALGFLLSGETLRGLLLIGLGIGVISSIDNILRPIYTRVGALQLPMLLIIVSVLGGFAMFGPTGAVLGPLVTRLAKEALIIAREQHDSAPS